MMEKGKDVSSNCLACHGADGNGIPDPPVLSSQTDDELDAGSPEAVRLELFTRRFTRIVEEMGEQLRRTAVSTNVKEREDYSCALLDAHGDGFDDLILYIDTLQTLGVQPRARMPLPEHAPDAVAAARADSCGDPAPRPITTGVFSSA